MAASHHIFPFPTDLSILGIPGIAIHYFLLIIALSLFVFIMGRRISLLRLAAPDPRWDSIGERIRRMLSVGFGQSRQPRYPFAGILHILIFFGFLILLIRSISMLGQGLSPGFTLPGLGGGLGEIYASVKDYTELIVLICCILAFDRRLFFRPARYHDRTATSSHSHEAYLVLGLIALLMVADAAHEGSEMAQRYETTWALPAASIASLLMSRMLGETLVLVYIWSFWIHNIALLFFLCYLPVSKHFHVITAIPNVFFFNRTPGGEVKPPRYGVESSDDLDSLGVGRLEDFTWKHILDFYSCTDCGRCSDQCPAYNTGTPLSPRMISIKSRDAAYQCHPILGGVKPQDSRPAMVGEVIKDDELWACTTCGACEETCPVLIEYVDKIVDMRRFLVDEGRVPTTLQKPLADSEKRGNPYGKMGRKRGDWIKDEDGAECGVQILGKGETADLLYFTDSCTAYDPRIQEIARAFGRVMRAAGVVCGTMGKDEVDSGHEMRRIGEEGLFEALRDKNLDALAERDFGRIVTTDPHAYNAILNDYSQEKPVLHHTQLLSELVGFGKVPLKYNGDGRVYTFHDPCYMGRHNGVYDEPRKVMGALPGIKTVEMAQSKNRSFCCGGGSLYLFYEGESDSRMSEVRLKMAEDAGASVVVTACPFCLINLDDAIKTTGREGKMEVIDLAELVARSMVDEPTKGIEEP